MEEENRPLWGREKEKNEFLEARDGDWLFFPFQCEGCHFYNIYSRSPVLTSPFDMSILSYIRRANLDMFWSRRPGTIESNLRNVSYILEGSRGAGFDPPLATITAWKAEDTEGMRLAIIALKKSRVKNGKNAISKTHLQTGTVRKLLSTARVLKAATRSGEGKNLVLRTIKGETQRFRDGMESSYFLETFLKGMKIRMGLMQRRNVPVTSELVLEILRLLEEGYKNTEKDFLSRRRYLLAGTLVSVLYGGSLRGYEGFMLDADTLAANIEFGKDADIPHVLVPLYGRFKGETGERFHVIPLKVYSKL